MLLVVSMDHRQSQIWKETLQHEKRCKEKWQTSHLSADELDQHMTELNSMPHNLPPQPRIHATRMGEEEACLRRLSNFGRPSQSAPAGDTFDGNSLPPVAPAASYLLARQRIIDQVTATRPRSHRLTKDKNLSALLGGIGPGLWLSMNPGYVHANERMRTTSSQAFHRYDDKWKVPSNDCGPKYHIFRHDFVEHADKALELGEKPFKSGGMKLQPTK